jgi:hypothetical protein
MRGVTIEHRKTEAMSLDNRASVFLPLYRGDELSSPLETFAFPGKEHIYV